MPTAIQAQIIDLQEYREIKDVVSANIKSFVKSGSPRAREAMHAVVNAIMKNHNKTKMTFGSFEVRRSDDRFGVTIRARKHASRRDVCPSCSAPFRGENVTLVQVQKEGFSQDLVAWGCRHCQEVFSRIEYTGGGFNDA